jgi:hypothetical protein
MGWLKNLQTFTINNPNRKLYKTESVLIKIYYSNLFNIKFAKSTGLFFLIYGVFDKLAL